MTSKKTKSRELSGLREVLAFTGGKTVANELGFIEISKVAPSEYADQESGVRFTDGSALVVRVVARGFRGSDVTAPDPMEVVYYAIDAEESHAQ